MTATATSREAYYQHVLNGGARRQMDVIMRAYLNAQIPLSRRQVSQLTGVEINAVCGRVKALLDSGYLQVAHVAVDPQTGCRVQYLEPVRVQPKPFQPHLL